MSFPLVKASTSCQRFEEKFLKIFMFRLQLLEHMGALHKYLLLSEGDIMRYLLDLLESELS